MFRKLLFFVLCTGVATQAWAGNQKPVVADSPQTIRPLLIGAEIPEVTLARPDGTPFDLKEAIAKQPTIVVFYRGGW